MNEQEKAYYDWASKQVPGTVTGLDIWEACATWHEQNMSQKSQNNDTSAKHVAGKTEQRLAEIEERFIEKLRATGAPMFDFEVDIEFLLTLVHQQNGELERCREAVGRYRGALVEQAEGAHRERAQKALEDEA